MPSLIDLLKRSLPSFFGYARISVAEPLQYIDVYVREEMTKGKDNKKRKENSGAKRESTDI